MNNTLDLSMDLTGPFNNNKDYILVVVDRTSRFVWTYNFRETASAQATIEKLNEFLNDRNTPISRIISDNGSQFRSKTWQDYLRARNIVCSLKSTYYLQGHGLTEGHIYTLQKKLRLLCYERKDTWDILVRNTTDAMNNTISKATNKKPRDIIEIIRQLNNKNTETSSRENYQQEIN
jgi:Integrase core domain